MFIREIPGGHATFRESKELRGRDRLLVQAAMWAAPMDRFIEPKGEAESEEDYQKRVAEFQAQFKPLTWQENLAILEVKQAVVVSKLSSWHLLGEDGKPRPLPTMETIGDLDVKLYLALEEESGADQLTVTLETDFAASRDDESPTKGSGDSAGPSNSPENDETTSPTIDAPTRRPKPSGAATATARSSPA